MIVTVHAPPRGFFTSRFALPTDTPPVLVGPRGEIARRIEQLDSASAIYQMAAFAEQLDQIDTYPDGTVSTMSYLNAAPPGFNPQFVAHPALADDLAHLLRSITIDGAVAGLRTVRPDTSSAVHRCWSVETALGDVAVIMWLHFASMSSIVEVEGIVRSLSGAAVRPHVRIEFSESVSPCFRGGCSSPIIERNVIDIHAIADTAAWHPFRARIVAKLVGEVDITASSDPLAELTADEHAWASFGPWFGREIDEEFGEVFLGLPIAGVPDAVGERAIADWANASNQKRPLAPRSNPNAGGTDDSFGPVCSVPWSTKDPRIVRALLWSSEAWMQHPIHYSEPGSVKQLSPPPAHDGLTTHKLQPWQGKIGEVVVPIGRSAILGRDPFDPQHRAFLLPITMRALTGSPMLAYWIEHWMAAELYDRDTIAGFSGNGRQVGRILYNVVAAYHTCNDPRWLDYAIEVARQSKEQVDRLTASTDNIRPCFTSDRGLPWEGWTPWEEAQRAVGLFQLWRVTANPEHYDSAWDAAYTVASVLGYTDGVDGVWWLPYRCRFTQTPDVSSMQSPDVYSPNAGPNGLFAWSLAALRMLCHIAADGTSQGSVIHRAAQAVAWADAQMRDHVVDAQMSMRCAWLTDVASILDITE